jgi:hypothetical protein
MHIRACIAIVTALLVCTSCLEAVPNMECDPTCWVEVVQVIDGNTIKLSNGMTAVLDGSRAGPLDSARGQARYECLKDSLLYAWIHVIAKGKDKENREIITIRNRRTTCQ